MFFSIVSSNWSINQTANIIFLSTRGFLKHVGLLQSQNYKKFVLGIVSELNESSLTCAGETFVLFNQQVKGNRREMIQLGVPIFGQIREESANNSQTSMTYSTHPIFEVVKSYVWLLCNK